MEAGFVDSQAGIIKAKYRWLSRVMDERMCRWWAGSEALIRGRGGITLVSQATGLNRNTVAAGVKEIQQGETALGSREGRSAIRRPGGGRKSLGEHNPGLKAALERLVEPVTRGDPTSPLRWTCKSVRRLAQELQSQGYKISPPTVAELLYQMDYSLQANRKTREGAKHPDRNSQFELIATRTQEFMERGQPVVSIDNKKCERVGNFKNAGREWRPKGSPERVRIYDFVDPALGKAILHGIYDVGNNSGWVSVGVDHDTAEFAVESLRRWWKQMGSKVYPRATQLLITADGGGSNNYRSRLWKTQLQNLVDETGLEISVCHFPPGTSKWNKIEHRMFCHITENWRGQPLVSHEVIINLISGTTTTMGLKIQASLDTNRYPKGIKVSAEAMRSLQIQPEAFHGEWNYTVLPRKKLEDPNIREK
ncbi:MAG: ISAzo13 family transposase [Candidatus Binatia bacterium]